MIAEMITSAYLTIGTCGTHGYSQSARFISDTISKIPSNLDKPEFYFSIRKKVLPELDNVFSYASELGWDGYNAEPVRPETYFHVKAFLESIPNTIPIPTVGVEPDGQITLEWYKSPSRLLSVSVGPGEDLNYAALIGPSKSYGTEVFSGEMPKTILDLIQRVIPE